MRRVHVFKAGHATISAKLTSRKSDKNRDICRGAATGKIPHNLGCPRHQKRAARASEVRLMEGEGGIEEKGMDKEGELG